MEHDKTAPSAVEPASGPLLRGTVVAGRFTIEHLAGRGGMGFVYRALDATTGRPVALKLLQAMGSPESAHRFNREAQVLEGLSHPGLVAYVAHGTTEKGQAFLAMEWLAGEELAQRLVRAPLSLSEVLALLRRVADALTQAHRRGIVHRDLKPSNLFLRGGRPEDVVVLDFGLARHTLPTLTGLTGSHTVVGTPGYMAPEQASSQPEIPPAADIFSLGCVLYECLTGKPPFAAPHFAAALAKILFADPAPLNAVRPGLPAGLQGLVDRMLAKDLRRRLADADALLEALSKLEAMPETPLPLGEVRPMTPSLEDAEQKLVSVLLVSPRILSREDETADWNQGVVVRDSLRTLFVPHGAQVELLADGSLVATLLPERGVATDQAALAARCALTFKERWPDAAVVLVTGLGVLNKRLPVGDAMERAGQLLRKVSQASDLSQVVMDEVTAGLLGPSFQLSRFDSGAFLLQGERLSADESRPLLGKPTPCVGREQELALLEFTFEGCVDEPAARAVLVTAPAGTGKSRLRHELQRRIERREPRPLVLLGRGDPMSMGSSYGLLGLALRGMCGIVDGQSLEEQRKRLSQRVSRHLPREDAASVEFLGELCAIPFPEEGHPHLSAARSDPRQMSTQLGRALVSFLKAECSHHPVVLVLEDLHWSDVLTVQRVDEALRELAEQPFMVLAMARPEVKERFPHLWSRRLQEVPLHGLSRKAGSRLVREVLGPQTPDALVQRMVELSDGNALFLEELIRMAAAGRGTEAPETVLAVLRARLARMDAGVRQVLMAASIFGRTFWPGGVQELLGPQISQDTLARHLRELVDQEVIEPRPDSHLPPEPEYRFRHALVQDAAYGLVADSYRPTGHRLAGLWLEQRGEVEPRVLATHFQLGAQPERALHFYTLAAERLFERNDLPGTMRCVEAALACNAEGGKFVRLRAIQAVVSFWMDDLPGFLANSGEVLEKLEVGSQLWCWLVGGQIIAGVYCGMDPEETARLNRLLRGALPEPEAGGAYTWAVACLGLSFVYAGARWELEAWLGWMKEKEKKGETEGVDRAWTDYMEGFLQHLFLARPWRAFVLADQSMRAFQGLGLERNALIVQTCAGLALGALGDVPGAIALLREVLEVGGRLEALLAVGAAQTSLSIVLAASPEPEHRREAYALVKDWVDSKDSYSFRRGFAHAVMAKVLVGEGSLSEAETHARQACVLLAPHQADVIYAHGALSAILLAQGRAAEAREVAETGGRALEKMASQGVYAVAMRLALAEACFGVGDVKAGEDALRATVQCVRERARDIPEPATRERFLRQVSENARALTLARERWGEDYFSGT